jgi:hypothetical protein
VVKPATRFEYDLPIFSFLLFLFLILYFGLFSGLGRVDVPELNGIKLDELATRNIACMKSCST